MNCVDYLAVLSTLPLDELAYGSARDHAVQCRDCDRITRVVVERERNLRMAYGEVRHGVAASHLAERAVLLSRRRTIARLYRAGLALAIVLTMLYVFMSRRVVPGAITTVSETFRLQCLSPEQAAEALRPELGATGRISIRPGSPLGIIHVEAPPREMERARLALERYDTPAASQCAVTLTLPKAR